MIKISSVNVREKILTFDLRIILLDGEAKTIGTGQDRYKRWITEIQDGPSNTREIKKHHGTYNWLLTR